MEWLTRIVEARDEELPKLLSRALVLTVGIYLFIIPFPHRTAIQEICFYSSLVFLALLYGMRNPWVSFRTPLTGPFLLFTAWVFVGLFFAMNPENSIHDFFAYLIKDLALFFLVYNTFFSRNRFLLLTWLLIVSAGLFSSGGILYFYGILRMPLETRLGLPEVGLGVNYIGYVTALALCFSATHLLHFRKVPGICVALVSVASATIATLFTQTKGTLLGFLPILFVFFARKWVFVLVSAVVGLLILVMPIKQLFTAETNILRHLEGERRILWYHYHHIVRDYPITGIGFGMQTYRMDLLNPYLKDTPSQYKMEQFHAPHNTFIDVAVRCGVPGLVLFLYILFAFARTGLWLIRHSEDPFIKKWALCLVTVFASYLIQGLFSDLLLGIQVKYFFIILAMMAILWKWHAESSIDVE